MLVRQKVRNSFLQLMFFIIMITIYFNLFKTALTTFQGVAKVFLRKSLKTIWTVPEKGKKKHSKETAQTHPDATAPPSFSTATPKMEPKLFQFQKA